MIDTPEPFIPTKAVPQFLALVEELSVGEPVPCRRESPELWWATKSKWEEAKGLCRQCRAREACLDYALAADERFGVWGGRAPNERKAGAS